MTIILTGGFLGSGKTTAIIKACKLFQERDVSVGVITNDQGEDHVDSRYVTAMDIPNSEVVNGCFCCNYDKLDEQLSALVAQSDPKIIFAEAVGSCTDLVATVAKPLLKFRRDINVVISVFVDAALVSAILQGNASFISESVQYIFKKQIEEADIVIVNKEDSVTPQELKKILDLLKLQYPDKILHAQNSHEEDDVLRWLTMCHDFTTSSRRSLEVDYDMYAAGEGELAWGNNSVTIESANGDAVRAAEHLVGNIFDRLQTERLTVGHLKFLIESNRVVDKVSFTTMSTSRAVRLTLPASRKVNVTINARVQSSAAALSSIVKSAVADTQKRFDCEVKSGRESFFSPKYPTPTHRL
jgi:G3E family GTPase